MEPKAPHANCEDCPLIDCTFVPSYRPSGKAPFIVLGEAPGLQEARQGKPFVGPSGALLAKALGNLGVDFEQVHRINAVGCKAPDNDVPVEAMVACMPRLKAELEAAEAEQVLALGNTALDVLDHISGNRISGGITTRRGSIYPLGIGEKTYLPTFHPAYVLRTPANILPFYADLHRLVHGGTSIDVWKIRYIVVEDGNWKAFTKILDDLPDGYEVAFDTETANLQLWETPALEAAPLLCLVLTISDRYSFIIPAETLTPKRLAYITGTLNRFEVTAHNGKYDQNVLARIGAAVRLDHDTMLLSYALNEQGVHGLKPLATQYLGAEDYEGKLIDAWFEEHKISKDKRNYGLLPKLLLYRYAAIDGVVTRLLKPLLLQAVIDDGVYPAYETLMKGSALTQIAEFKGIKVDRAYLERADLRLYAELESYTHDMWGLVQGASGDMIIGPPYYKNPVGLIAPFEKEPKGSKAFNPGSTDQMSWAIFKLFRLRHVKTLSFKTKSNSTNEESLEALEPHAFVDLLKKYRRVAKIRNTYVKGLQALADVQDRVHVNFKLHGTETGRLSAGDSLHGIPRPEDFYGRMIAGAFVAEKGHKLIKADFSQAELRAFAAESKEPFLLEKYRSGEDVHLGTAQITEPFRSELKAIDPALLEAKKLKHVPEEHAGYERLKYFRQIAKQINFGGLVYLGGPSGIAAMLHGYGIEIKPAQLAPVLADYKAKTPTAVAWQNAQFMHAKMHGYVQSRLGRKRRFLLITADNLEEVRKASVNAPIQSVASDLNLLAAWEIFFRHGIWVIHMIHDSIICEVPEALADWAAQVVKKTMEDVASRVYPEVPWEADVEIVSRLYENRPEGLLG
jgi:uracil-DNA glycosylase family 4